MRRGKIVAIAELFQHQAESSSVGFPSPPSADGLNGPSIATTETYLNLKLRSSEGLAVFLVELLDKEAMIKLRGREMVYAMTRTMIHTVADLISVPHFLGRWHGDRFLVVVPSSTEESFQELLGELEG
jgi:GGDEF domain-containing protein